MERKIEMNVEFYDDFDDHSVVSRNERILNSIISITRLSFLPYPLNEKDSTIQNIRIKCKIEINVKFDDNFDDFALLRLWKSKGSKILEKEDSIRIGNNLAQQLS